ncbi:MAG: hypothetical protein A3I05_02960 [Deltaproteobacteria bacterium RIFCSPLOWO2_02_FULL_44_10]|nr:MAG: hypothetical protein A3C46_05730 [Deltaproteobacteria bacterium RIFCSPHIGHO2_02_FULL_44_16]OGQ45087.1 MAG: hypothetical protein A3I05_02960 [Deltaproteobacteria bacterium RIFCSPLOWO2_02_FULL_44_10]
MEMLESLLTTPDVSIKTAWKKLNDNGYKVLFVVSDERQLMGIVTDGDVRRWVLEEKSLLESVQKVMNPNPIAAQETEDLAEMKKKLLDHRIDCIPVIDLARSLKRVIFWNEILDQKASITEKMELPVVIMAGGKGARLDPFTKILPKPLVPIGDKPVIEVIMERFARFGAKHFYISLNYKANMIKAYFQDCVHSHIIEYIQEEKPCGTAGSISLLQGKLSTPFIVCNADILIDANYADMVRFHAEQKNKITLVCSMKHFPIPYGVVEIENGGELKTITEKPEFDHLVLTGLYIVEPELIRLIPRDQEFHMTHLIEKLRAEGEKIGVYPVSEKAWMDVGELESYRETLRKFQ